MNQTEENEATNVSGPNHAAQKLRVEQVSEGPITLLKLAGIIDEQFDGKGISGSLGPTQTLLLELSEIDRISSFGIREFVDFMQQIGRRVPEIYFIELAPKVVDQFNMVANFGGSGRVYSFYVPYRCDYCDDERRRLFMVDRDAEVIKSQRPPQHACKTCGNAEYFDGDAPSFFHFLQGQPRLAIPPHVAAFLAERLKYSVAEGAKKLKIDKEIEGRATYIRLSGDLDASFPREKLADGLEGDVILDLNALGRIEPVGAAEWRTFLAEIGLVTERLFLVGCPPGFVEKLTSPEDLVGKAQVLSINLPYACARCSLTVGRLIDVAEHHALLQTRTAPPMPCRECGGATTCSASETLLQKAGALPRPQPDDAILAFIRSAQQRVAARTTPALGIQAVTAGDAVLAAAAERLRTTSPALGVTAAPSRFAQVALATLVALVVSLGAVATWGYLRHPTAPQGEGGVLGLGKLLERKPDPTPAWVKEGFKAPPGQLSYAGSSLPALELDEALGEADDAALEAIANDVANHLTDPRWVQHVKRQYEEERDSELTAVTKALNDQDMARYDAAVRAVRESRHRIAEALRHTGSGLVPTARTGSYYEKYDTPRGIRYRVYSQMVLTPDAFDQLVGRYKAIEEGAGAAVMTYMPELSWTYDLTSGAVVVALGTDSTLRARGVVEGSIVTAVQGSQVVDAAGFASLVSDAKAALMKTGGTFVLKAVSGRGPAVEYSIPVAPPAPTVIYVPVGQQRPQGPPHEGNIFDDDPNR